MRRTGISKRDLAYAGSFFVFSLIMIVAALATDVLAADSPGDRCAAAPTELLVHDVECRSVDTTPAEPARRPAASSATGLEWFLVSVIVGVAVLAALTIEAPATRPFVPPTTHAVRF